MGPLQSVSSDDNIDALLAFDDSIPWTKQLLATVIRRAVVDFVLYAGHEQSKQTKLGEDAAVWLFTDNVDFAWYCAALDLPVWVVRAMARSLSEAEARALRGLDFEGDDEDGD